MGHRQGSLAHILDILYAGSLFALHWHFQNQSPSIPIDNKDLEEAQERPPRWWQLEHSPSEERDVGGTSLVQPGWMSGEPDRSSSTNCEAFEETGFLRWSMTKEYKTLGIN